MSEKTRNILEWIECIVIAVVLALLIRYYLGTPTIVKQESMYPTLKQNERLILNRWGRTTKKMPERGDIITFEAPSKSYISPQKADLENPVAVYENGPKSALGKFAYYVLEWGKTSYIKRVIGLPGDHVKIENEKVYVNDKELEESYLQSDVVTTIEDPGTSSQYAFGDIVVPENCVFAMGDNREYSRDCRSFGCVPLEKIEGKVVIRFFPFNKFGKVN